MVCLIEFGSEAYDEAFTLRELILRKPLGLQYTEQDLAGEEKNIHIACYKDNKIVGYLQLKPLAHNGIKMRQVAVHTDYQGKNIGKSMVEYAEAWSKSMNISFIELHARETAVPFYQKLDYVIEKDPFEEVGLPHRYMIKRFR